MLESKTREKKTADRDDDFSIIHVVFYLHSKSSRKKTRTDAESHRRANGRSASSSESRWNWLKEMCWCKKIFIRWFAPKALASGRLPISIERRSHPIYFLLLLLLPRRRAANDCRLSFLFLRMPKILCEQRREKNVLVAAAMRRHRRFSFACLLSSLLSLSLRSMMMMMMM